LIQRGLQFFPLGTNLLHLTNHHRLCSRFNIWVHHQPGQAQRQLIQFRDLGFNAICLFPAGVDLYPGNRSRFGQRPIVSAGRVGALVHRSRCSGVPVFPGTGKLSRDKGFQPVLGTLDFAIGAIRKWQSLTHGPEDQCHEAKV